MLLNAEQLQKWLGYSRPKDVEKWLRKHAVPYYLGPRGPVTTEEAINKKLLGNKKEDWDFA